MSFFHSLQDSAFTDWFLGSDSIWTYPTVLTLHTVGMAMLVGASIVIHLRVLRVGTGFPLERLRGVYKIAWVGFSINLFSGVVLFITEAADRAADPVFYIKLASIALALWLGVIVKRRLVDRGPAPATKVRVAQLLSLTSLGLWTVAIVAGRLMAYLKK
jgi:hypothetical protein